jgi:hypothetical protein
LKDVAFEGSLTGSIQVVEREFSLHNARASAEESIERTDFAPPVNALTVNPPV